MALNWTTSSSTPSDAIGSDGDMNFDYGNRIIWGPKGQSTAGSWVGTANTTKGAQGLGILSGTGSPLSSMGQQGNSYVDVSNGALWLRGSSGWSQTGSVINQFSPILQGAGPPNSSTAPNVLTGQMYFDNNSNLLYGPSTSASYTGLTQVFNMVGPSGAPGPTGSSTSFRNSVRGEWWRAGASVANTAYSVCAVLSSSSTSSGNQAYDIALMEPMYASGSLTAVSAFAVSSVPGVLTLNLIKNGTNFYTVSNLMTVTSTPPTAVAKMLPTGLTFAANDVITMTVSTSTASNNQHAFFNLFYTTNS